MVPPTTPPTKSSGQGRQSILGRLSLSPSHKGQKPKTPDNAEAPPRVPQKHGARSAWTPERIPFAGPSYESMYPQTPPKRTNALNGQGSEDFRGHQVTDGGVGKPWSPLRTSESAYHTFQHCGASTTDTSVVSTREPLSYRAHHPEASSYTTSEPIHLASTESKSHLSCARIAASHLPGCGFSITSVTQYPSLCREAFGTQSRHHIAWRVSKD
jgi:hypothetical protein